MTPELKKLRAQAWHLLDGFIGLRERYAILQPMFFDQEVIDQNGQRQMARGFAIIKNNLFLFCCQDIAKLTLDEYESSASIKKIVRKLEDKRFLVELERELASNYIAPTEKEMNPTTNQALTQYWEREPQERLQKFRQDVGELTNRWGELSSRSSLASFKIIRNKVSAHLDVNLVNGEYRPFDIGALDIKWKDMATAIYEMQVIVALIGSILRDASFAWESLDLQLKRAAQGFWKGDI